MLLLRKEESCSRRPCLVQIVIDVFEELSSLGSCQRQKGKYLVELQEANYGISDGAAENTQREDNNVVADEEVVCLPLVTVRSRPGLFDRNIDHNRVDFCRFQNAVARVEYYRFINRVFK